jgi:hypothetical protein
MKFITSIFVFTLFYGCTTLTQEKKIYKWQKDSLIIKWRIDSEGCNGYRTDARMDSIFKEYNLASKSIDSIKIILGEPNAEWESETGYGLKYFFGTLCTNDTLNPESDKCWIDIQFEKNNKILNSFSAACE